jgi:hypothetical protein
MTQRRSASKPHDELHARHDRQLPCPPKGKTHPCSARRHFVDRQSPTMDFSNAIDYFQA